MKVLNRVLQGLMALTFLSVSVASHASICMDIYTKVKNNGCVILKKLPQAETLCDLVNGSVEGVCEWCSEHSAACLAVAGAILFNPEEGKNKLRVVYPDKTGKLLS